MSYVVLLVTSYNDMNSRPNLQCGTQDIGFSYKILYMQWYCYIINSIECLKLKCLLSIFIQNL
jgi:hypothetical protein